MVRAGIGETVAAQLRWLLSRCCVQCCGSSRGDAVTHSRAAAGLWGKLEKCPARSAQRVTVWQCLLTFRNSENRQNGSRDSALRLSFHLNLR